jgi:hypothetical protein
VSGIIRMKSLGNSVSVWAVIFAVVLMGCDSETEPKE